MSIAWLITTVIALAGLALAVATFTGKGPTLKRIHYSSVSFRFLLPSLYDATSDVELEPRMTVRRSGEDLILPQIVLLRMENTGKAPIQTSDFAGNLNIELGKRAIFRSGMIVTSRDNVLDFARTEVSRRSHGHLALSPMLLNPRDSLTFVLLVDGEVDASVAARIAGVEALVKLPNPLPGGTNLQMTATSTIYEKRVDWPPVRYVNCMITTMPMLLDPSGQMASEVDVRTAGILLEAPYFATLNLACENGVTAKTLRAFDRADFRFKFEGSVVKRIVMRIGDQITSERRSSRLVHSTGGTVRLDSSIVDFMEDSIRVDVFLDGLPERIVVLERPEWVENPMQFKVEANLSIDDHLASTQPRILLADQRLYSAWGKLQRKARRVGPELQNAYEKFRRWTSQL